jgi:hypothetical protein
MGFLDHLPAFAGSLPAWITSAASVSLLGVVLRYRLGLGRLKVDAGKVEVTALEVSGKDEADIRDHYADEVKQLRNRLDQQSERHRQELMAEAQKHDLCQKDREQLRDDGRALKDVVAGLIRIIAQASASKAISLDTTASVYVREAAERVQLLYNPLPLSEPHSHGHAEVPADHSKD